MIRLAGLDVDGFRGYARAESIRFGRGSVLIFGPNGHGKSSLTDAFEFLFSPNGTLERLGERDQNTNTGRLPLRNTNRPADQPVTVTLTWKEAGTARTATREARTEGNSPPSDLAPLIAKRVVPFVVRGHDLRGDVESTTPQQRYARVAEYLGASRLAELQADLRSLKTKLTRGDDSERRRKELKAQVKGVVGAQLELGDEPAVVSWLTTLLCSLGLPPPGTLSLDDSALRELGDRAAEERAKRGGDALVRAHGLLTNLLSVEAGVSKLLLPIQRAKDAAVQFGYLAAETADGRRHALLAPAIAILEREESTVCPVCESTLQTTPYQDRLRLAEHLRELQQHLVDIATAKTNADSTLAVSRSHRETTAQLIRTVGALTGLEDGEHLANAWLTAFDAADSGNPQLIDVVTERLAVILADVDARRAALEAQGPPVFQRAFEHVQAVVSAVAQRRIIDTRGAELAILQSEVEQVRTLVNTAVHGFLQGNVAALGSDTATIYNRIQQDAAVPVAISIRLTDPDAADARGVEMVLTFPGAGETKPQGYLSDSQLNTLALAFRIAVIRRFNTELPFVVLDDVLTSHDAEFRDQAAETIVTELADLQLLVLTHDDMFARLLEDKVTNRGTQSDWSFLRIVTFDLDRGPRFLTRLTTEQTIMSAWDRGERAAGALRSYVEEWLERTCRTLGARFTMRPKRRPYDYSHWEMATTLQQVLKEKYNADAVMSAVPEFGATIAEIVNAVVENEGAHHHDNPYGGSDVAMERRFWGRFKRLQEYFRCEACGGKLAYRESSRRAACAKDDCGMAFHLQPKLWQPAASTT